MSRDDGFDRMDVSTNVHNDPKFRALARRHPELYPVAFTIFVSTMAESWREAERLTADEGWPLLLPFDGVGRAAIDALVEAGLFDDEQRVSPKAWAGWFGAASERRRLGRERQRRADEKRGRTRPSDSPSDSQEGPVRQDRQVRADRADRQTDSQSGPSTVQRRSSGGPRGNGHVDPLDGEGFKE